MYALTSPEAASEPVSYVNFTIAERAQRVSSTFFQVIVCILDVLLMLLCVMLVAVNIMNYIVQSF